MKFIKAADHEHSFVIDVRLLYQGWLHPLKYLLL
jgi:hypothetical protein